MFLRFSFPGARAVEACSPQVWQEKGRCLHGGARGWDGCQRGVLPGAELCPDCRPAVLTKVEIFLAFAFSTYKEKTSVLANPLPSVCLMVAALLAPHPRSPLSGQKVVKAGGATTTPQGGPAGREVAMLVVGLGAGTPMAPWGAGSA